MFDRLSHVMLYVLDLDRAVKWYGEVLDFTARFVAPGHFASLTHVRTGMRLDLHPVPEGASRPEGATYPPLPYLAASDLDATLEELARRGVRTSGPHREGSSPRFASFWDSEGNCLGLEEVSRDPSSSLDPS